jgi:hypothetical protein
VVIGTVALGGIALAIGFRATRPNWVTVGEGPVQGVAWKALNDRDDAPVEAGPLQNWHRPESGAFDFVYRTPAEAALSSAFLITPNGGEVPLRDGAAFQDHRFRSVQIPRNYPPDISHLDLVIKTPGVAPSRFRLLNPPSTKLRFEPLPMPSLLLGGIKLESVAWSQPPLGDALPVTVAAMRIAEGITEGMGWLLDVRFLTPFQNPADPGVDATTYVSEDGPGVLEPGIGRTFAHEWSSEMPSVRIEGWLATFDKLEEEVDLGEIEVRASPQGQTHRFDITAAKPITFRLRDGSELILEGLKEFESVPNRPGGAYLAVKASIKDPKATLLTGGHFFSMASFRVRSGFFGHSFWDPKAIPIEWEEGKVGRQRLKLFLKKSRLLSDRQFFLQPKVEHRATASARFAELGKMGSSIGFMFHPTAEDFSSLSTPHN